MVSPRPPARRIREPGWQPGTNPWLLVGTLIGAKLGTIVIILVFSWNAETGGLVAANNWHWLPVIGALLAGPVAWRVRMTRARKQREALLRSEWMLDDPPPSRAAKPVPPGAVDSGFPQA